MILRERVLIGRRQTVGFDDCMMGLRWKPKQCTEREATMILLRTDPVLLLLVLVWIPVVTNGLIDVDGLCSIYAFVPFTAGGGGTVGFLGDNRTNDGFSHMAAALLAMEHFNARNDTVVPELSSELIRDCNVMFNWNTSAVLDTGSLTQKASQSLFQQGIVPCGLVGPFNDLPALELSTMAQAAQFPQVAHRSYNVRLVSNFYNRFTSQVYPDMINSAHVLSSFLFYKNRTDFIGFLYSLTDAPMQRREALTFYLDERQLRWKSSAYINLFAANTFILTSRSQKSALEVIKKSGYRTIVVAMDNAWSELQGIADAAEALEMNRGDHFWIFYDIFEPVLVYNDNENITKLVSGSALLLPVSSAFLGADEDPFDKAWRSQGKQEVDRLNSFNPITPGQPGYKFAEKEFFREVPDEYGIAFIYDAVMALGIGGCLARRENGTVSGIDHVEGIRRAKFTGATGQIEFGNDDNDSDRNGTRLASTVTWGAFNLLPPRPDGGELFLFELTDILSPNTGEMWKAEAPFVYRDGRTVPPDLLRDEPDQNYLSPGLRVMGFTLMGITLLLAIASVAWVYVCRKHHVLVASQPLFLYLLCFGAVVEVTSIITISNDESFGWSTKALSRACMATPWLISLGHMITYTALFTKLWRVNKVLQFSRRKIEIRHVVGPMLVLVLAALVVLSLWTAIDPLEWQREEINETTGESIGQCESDHYAAFLGPLIALVVIPAAMTAAIAWKTKDVSQEYAESSWIFILILVHLEVMAVASPIVVILRDVSTDARYVGFAIMLWIFPTSTLLLILLPKFLAYHRSIRGLDAVSQVKRGQRHEGGVKISGITKGKEMVNSSTDSASAQHSGPAKEVLSSTAPETIDSPEDT